MRSSKLIDLYGEKFGRLYVVGLNSAKRADGVAFWNCVCDCGVFVCVKSQALRTGKTQSCGCLWEPSIRASRMIPDRRLAGFRSIVNHYIHAAKKKGHEWSLPFETARELMESECHYCGVSSSLVHVSLAQCRTKTMYNGIDRIDNTVGYVPGNVVACCTFCNFQKSNHDYDEFVGWINRVSDNLNYKSTRI